MTPHGIGVSPAGDVYVADTGNNRIQKFTSERGFITAWGAFGAGIGQFNHPHEADSSNSRVQKIRVVGCLRLELSLSGSGNDTLLVWSEPSGAESYCVEMGDLGVLRVTDGDFRMSIVQELASHTTATSLLFAVTPGPGEAYWFLVKDNPAGTFDTGCPSQVGSRDQEIMSSGDVCVN